MPSSLFAPFVEAAERQAGTDQKRFGSVLGSSEALGDVGDRETVEISQRKRTAMMSAELLEHNGDAVLVEHRIPRIFLERGVLRRRKRIERIGGAGITASPMVEELVAGDTEKPGDGYLGENPLADLGHGGEECLAGELLRRRLGATTVPQVREDTRKRIVVEPQQRLAVRGFVDSDSHSMEYRSFGSNSDGLSEEHLVRPRSGGAG